jgi:succinyl-diaminopimelate desuccinylase
MFAGHTDVVPPGPEAQWRSPPFTPTLIDGVLYGRGAADMKSSLAAMVVAVEQVLTANPDLPGTLSFLITSDEEGDAIHGTRHAIDVLNQRGVKPDYCIVGEPSSTKIVGDVVRCGRRGSLNAKLIVHGVQGHVAYPNEAVNPIHQALNALAQLTTRQWDNGNSYYPPTSLQISNINAGTGVTNVIPGLLEVQFNLRFSTEQTSDGLQQTITDIFDRHEFNYELLWQHSGDPFLTEGGDLSRAVLDAIQSVQDIDAELSTSGGTSDGRFISPWGEPGSNQVEVIELGPTNATIHKVDECVALAELAPLALIYQRIVENLLTS